MFTFAKAIAGGGGVWFMKNPPPPPDTERSTKRSTKNVRKRSNREERLGTRLRTTMLHYIDLDTQARSQGGGGAGGVPTPPSGINDIHNFNCLMQERLFDCF